MRSGDAYVASLRDGRAVYLDGERVDDVTKHPAFVEPIRRIAETYDRAKAAANDPALTFADAPTGVRHSNMWLVPRSAEYDDEVRDRAIFTAEAGLSFFHLHGEGVGLVLFFSTALVAAVVPSHRARTILYMLLTLGGLFPLGYLVYGAAVLELGRDAGTELAERWLLTPLGISAIAGLVGLWLAAARRRP